MVEVTYAQLLAISISDVQQRKDITSVIMPDKLTSVPEMAFRFCNITSIDLPNTITSIGIQAFWDCESLTSIRLPDSLKTIPPSCFGYCSSITSITIPSSLTVCGPYAFKNCLSLTFINIPVAALNDRNTFGMSTIIGDYCDPFYCCTALEALSAPLNMTVVEYLRHELALREERIKRRVAMLICLERINNERIRRGKKKLRGGR